MSYNEASKKMKEIEQYELSLADVIVCSCSCSGDQLFKYMKFDAVVINESSHLLEPEQMIAISHT